MKNLKLLIRSLREFRLPAILTVLFIIGEVVIEVLIPFITANLINTIRSGVEMGDLLRTGGLIVVLAAVSLTCGTSAGFFSAKAGAGFSRNLRHDIFARVQSFSFENIDKFSSASLVTRMTTDIANIAMAFQMMIRIAVRAPLMLMFSIIMAFIMGGKLAATFVVIIPVMVGGLLMIGRKAMPAFHAVFKKYDRLNESIEENVRAMRVVKGFSREDYEKNKFSAASGNVARDFTRADRIVSLNSPLMQLCLFFNMTFVLWVGSKMIISTGGRALDVGQISAMLTYGMQILMSLMMLSMVYVMLTMSSESMKRVAEVLQEEPSLSSPAEPVMEVKDGSIDFKDVSFKYSAKAESFALRNVNLHIDSGMTVGVLGGTGSSKTTLIQCQ